MKHRSFPLWATNRLLSRIECYQTIGKTVLLFALFELSDNPALSSSHSQPVVCVDLCWAAALSVQTSNNNISLLCPWIISLPPTSLLILYVLTLRWVFPSLAVRSLCYHGNCLVTFTGTTWAVSIPQYFSSPASPHPLTVIIASKWIFPVTLHTRNTPHTTADCDCERYEYCGLIKASRRKEGGELRQQEEQKF